MTFYYKTDLYYNPLFKYMRFLYLIHSKISEIDSQFHYSHVESYFKQSKAILERPNYKSEMRSCLNDEPIAIAIRADKSDKITTINNRIKPNIIDRNEIVNKGCTFLQYSAFYGAKNCFKKLSTQKNLEEEKEFQVNLKSYEKRYVLSDFAACGGDLEIC